MGKGNGVGLHLDGIIILMHIQQGFDIIGVGSREGQGTGSVKQTVLVESAINGIIHKLDIVLVVMDTPWLLIDEIIPRVEPIQLREAGIAVEIGLARLEEDLSGRILPDGIFYFLEMRFKCLDGMKVVRVFIDTKRQAGHYRQVTEEAPTGKQQF